MGLIALCLWTGLTIGCGGGGGGSQTTQQLRVVMASPDAPAVDILIDGVQVATSLVYISNSTSIFDQTISLTASANLTLLLTGPASKIQEVLLTDGSKTTTTTTGTGKVRVVNASITMGPADVYIVNAGTGLAGATPVATSLSFDKNTEYESVPTGGGGYEVFMTSPGTTNLLLDTGALALTQSQFQTVIALDATGGGFNYIALTDQ
ncbi:MAG: hypothetical protein DMG92_14540 [Acidobacteria bacterium]|nr:MAG: hypothetical protein DMG92_14540 [Acidobacteriota bacterium]